MTSLKPIAAFAELSPEQRQALFDKLRQRKLTHARQPSTPQPLTQSAAWTLSPAQQTCLEVLPADSLNNRVLELVLEGELNSAAIEQQLLNLMRHHDGLSVRFEPQGLQAVPADQAIRFQFVQAANSEDAQQQLQQLREHLSRTTADTPVLQAAALQAAANTWHLLLAAHPLLLDTHSLLHLANQWLTLSCGGSHLEQIPPSDSAASQAFARWSTQVLEQKFLSQEWQRLKPKGVNGNETHTAISHHNHESLLLAADFIDRHLPEGQNIKPWIVDAVHRCLNRWLAHQETLFWFNTPQMRDSQFESLLGFFPYYVPIAPAGTEKEASTLTPSQRVLRQQTRFSPVSEQLAQSLCRQGSQVPLIHYHWFDLDTGAGPQLEVNGLLHHQSGILFAPVEIHVTEMVKGVNLDVHFDPARVGQDQVSFLLRDLMVYLREEKSNTAEPPTLHEHLRQIWQDLLQKNEIADDQSFFELGGHSLQVTELKFRIKQQLKLDMPISVLYELTTINKQANFILATQSGGLGFNAGNETTDEEEEEGIL